MNAKNGAYTDAEIEILKREYPILGVRRVHELLPHRSLISIQVRASKLGLKSGVSALQEWSSREDAALTKAYQKGNGLTDAIEAQALSLRTPNMISSRARRLGLKARGYGSHWTDQEIIDLSDMLDANQSVDEICRKLPLRTREAIVAQAGRISGRSTK